MFFDRPAVKKLMDKETHKFLRHGSLYARKVARSSIKKPPAKKLKDMTPEELQRFRIAQAEAKAQGKPAPKRPRVSVTSLPGQPPLDQTGALKGGILASVEPGKLSAVIGPVKLNKPGFGAQALEEGGVSEVAVARGTKRKRRRIRRRPFMGPALAKTTTPAKVKEFWGRAAA